MFAVTKATESIRAKGLLSAFALLLGIVGFKTDALGQG